MLDAIISTDDLEAYVETYLCIVDEARFDLTPDGVYGEVVDPATVAAINNTLHDTAFESYSSGGFSIGVDLTRLTEYLDAIQSDLVQIKYDAETRKLSIAGENTNFEMAGIDPDAIREGVDLDDMELMETVDVTLDGAALTHGWDVAGLVSDHTLLDADPDRDSPLHVKAEGDMDDASVEYEKSLHEGSTVDSAAVAMFSPDYLEDFGSVIPDDAEARLRFGDEYPARIDYEYLDGNAEASLQLAPRLQTD